MIKLARFLKDFKKQVFLGPLFKLIEAIFELIIPIIMARVIDIGVKNGDQPYVLKMGGVLVLLYIVGLCSTLVCQMCIRDRHSLCFRDKFVPSLSSCYENWHFPALLSSLNRCIEAHAQNSGWAFSPKPCS